MHLPRFVAADNFVCVPPTDAADLLTNNCDSSSLAVDITSHDWTTFSPTTHGSSSNFVAYSFLCKLLLLPSRTGVNADADDKKAIRIIGGTDILL
jgi:hypothetical protein